MSLLCSCHPSGLHIPNFKFSALGPLKFAVFMHFTGYLAHMLAQGLTTCQISQFYFHTFDLDELAFHPHPYSEILSQYATYMQRCLNNLFTPRLLSFFSRSMIQKPLLEIKFVQWCRFFLSFSDFAKLFSSLKRAICVINWKCIAANQTNQAWQHFSLFQFFIFICCWFYLTVIGCVTVGRCFHSSCFLFFFKSLTMRPSRLSAHSFYAHFLIAILCWTFFGCRLIHSLIHYFVCSFWKNSYISIKQNVILEI